MSRRHGLVALVGWELRGAVRSRWILGTALAFAAISLAVTLLGLRSLRQFGLAGVGPASAGLVNLGVLLPPLVGLLLGAGSLAGARERGLLPMMAAQPVSRGTLVVGMFLGLAVALWATVGLGFGLAALVFAGVAKAADLVPLAALAGTMLAVATAGLAVGMALSSLASTRTQAVAIAVALWFILALGMDLALAGLGTALRLGPPGLLVAVLVNPLEGARILALLAAEPGGTVLGPFGAYLVDSFGSVGAAVLLAGSLAAWTALPLAGASAVLARRNL